MSAIDCTCRSDGQLAVHARKQTLRVPDHKEIRLSLCVWHAAPQRQQRISKLWTLFAHDMRHPLPCLPVVCVRRHLVTD